MEVVEREERRRTPAADRILRAASEMFYREGIRATGVEAIAREADVTKKTIYDKFGSKDELIAAYLHARDERWQDWLQSVVEQHGSSARQRLLATFDALDEWMERENPRGCGFVNAAAELTDTYHPGRIVVVEQKRWLRRYLAELVAESGAEDPEHLAERLVILHEGAMVANSLGTVANAAQTAKETAACLLTEIE